MLLSTDSFSDRFFTPKLMQPFLASPSASETCVVVLLSDSVGLAVRAVAVEDRTPSGTQGHNICLSFSSNFPICKARARTQLRGAK